jgi:hypothetical protein
MPLLTGLLFNRYTWTSSLVRHLGPLPVFDLVIWTARRVKRRPSLFVVGLAIGSCLTLAIMTLTAA